MRLEVRKNSKMKSRAGQRRGGVIQTVQSLKASEMYEDENAGLLNAESPGLDKLSERRANHPCHWPSLKMRFFVYRHHLGDHSTLKVFLPKMPCKGYHNP